MKTIVIQGGTDGIGEALALTYLKRGDEVVVIGRSAAKGRALVEAGGPRASFIQADLSLVSENRRVIEEVKTRFAAVDALVLCARHYRSARRETAEGFEDNFALFYLSRFLLSHGLAESLDKAGAPVIMNVAGPGADMSALQWDDLQLERGYHGARALGHNGKLNDLLGVAFAAERGAERTRYVLFHPGMTATSFSGEYDAVTLPHIEAMRRTGKPVSESIAPIVATLDSPPAEPPSAFVEGRRISVAHASFDERTAMRLHDITGKLLAR